MVEIEPPDELEADTVPTSARIASARRQRDLHPRICVPEPVCQRCLSRYPCAPATWALTVLQRALLELGVEQ
jgi:hypothetical protein